MNDTTIATPEQIKKLSVAEIGQLERAMLDDAGRAAYDARLSELVDTARAEREAAAAERARSAETRAQLFELTVLPGLVVEHGEVDEAIAVVETGPGIVVVKRPDPMFFNRFVFGMGEKLKEAEVRKFVLHCAVYPDKEKVEAIFRAAPGALITACNRAVELGRSNREALQGK